MKSRFLAMTCCGVAAWLALGGLLVFAQAPSDPAAAPGAAAAAAPVSADATLDAFLQACRDNPQLGDTQKQEIATLAESLRNEAEGREQALTESLRIASPDFAKALEQLGEEQTADAAVALQKLAASEEQFLAAEAKFFLARAYILDERYEEALPLLDQLTGDKFQGKTLRAGEALFLKGVSHAELLQRPEAEKALQTYLAANPDAPERLRVGAQQRLEELKVIDDGSIADVQDRMDYSRRRLAIERSDKPTQTEQETIIAMLDKLIKEAEANEKMGSGSGSGRGRGRGRAGGRGGQNPAGGAAESGAGEGESEIGPLDRLNRKMPDGWGGLKDKEREEVLSALRAKFPDRYKALIEQYYRSLQDENPEDEDLE